MERECCYATNQITMLYKDPSLNERLSYVAGGTRLRLLEKGSDHLKVSISGADVLSRLQT
jgi:hypothetical protein